jgi:mRNA interferase MazF
MQAGQVVKVALQESDGKVYARPVLLLKKVPPHNDWLLCVISGKLHLENKQTDILISESHPDFATMLLKYPSLIRTAFVFTVSESFIEGVIGEVSKPVYQNVLENLSDFLLR